MTEQIHFDATLIRRYGQGGPRYTSYPAVTYFRTGVTTADYRRWARASNEDPIPRPLSLYVHVPFCDTACFYCASTTAVMENPTQAAAYLEYLYREIALQSPLFDRDRIVEELHWGGGTSAFLDTGECRSLMGVLRERFSLHLDDGGKYTVEIDPRAVNRDKLTVLRDIGFNRVRLGMQDIDPGMEQAVNRRRGMDLTHDMTEHARDLGFRSLSIDLMYGLPMQTVESFAQTLQHVIDLQPDRIAVYNYAHLPQRFQPPRGISTDDLPLPDVALDILQNTVRMLNTAGYVYIGMDHFCRPGDELAQARLNGTLHRNFQGYSTLADCDQIGFGLSAIGRVCDNYYQNACEPERYQAHLDTGRLPLERGIELEPDDLLRREIIMQLICDYRLDIAALEAKWRFDFHGYFSDEHAELQQMQHDGLLTLDASSLEVTPAGRLLVRNICMVFDHYLRGGDTVTRFSKVI
jgi:oxygen-independent coproporphyrinogen-3 oxidase